MGIVLGMVAAILSLDVCVRPVQGKRTYCILGDSEAIVRKHYAKWSRGRQTRISELLARIWHAKKSSVQVPKNEWDKVVDGMGFEPTTPALRTPCSPS